MYKADYCLQGILDCLSGEYDDKDGEKLEDMLGHLKKYRSLIDEVEAIRQIRPNRNDEDHRTVVSLFLTLLLYHEPCFIILKFINQN